MQFLKCILMNQNFENLLRKPINVITQQRKIHGKYMYTGLKNLKNKVCNYSCMYDSTCMHCDPYELFMYVWFYALWPLWIIHVCMILCIVTIMNYSCMYDSMHCDPYELFMYMYMYVWFYALWPLWIIHVHVHVHVCMILCIVTLMNFSTTFWFIKLWEKGGGGGGVKCLILGYFFAQTGPSLCTSVMTSQFVSPTWILYTKVVCY